MWYKDKHAQSLNKASVYTRYINLYSIRVWFSLCIFGFSGNDELQTPLNSEPSFILDTIIYTLKHIHIWDRLQCSVGDVWQAGILRGICEKVKKKMWWNRLKLAKSIELKKKSKELNTESWGGYWYIKIGRESNRTKNNRNGQREETL